MFDHLLFGIFFDRVGLEPSPLFSILPRCQVSEGGTEEDRPSQLVNAVAFNVRGRSTCV